MGRVLFPAWLMAMEPLGYPHHIVWLDSMHGALALSCPDRLGVRCQRRLNGSA
jgi:hypothetical protein